MSSDGGGGFDLHNESCVSPLKAKTSTLIDSFCYSVTLTEDVNGTRIFTLWSLKRLGGVAWTSHGCGAGWV